MSFLTKMFGGRKSGGKHSSTSEAIQKLREVEEMLLKKKEYLETKVEKEIEIIKQNSTDNKKVSLSALKRKKRLDAQLEQIEGTLTTIDTQRVALENANTNAEVLKVMSFATQALKQFTSQNMDMNKVEDIIDEMKEQQQIANEIQQMISSPIGGGDHDEEELLAELEDMNENKLLEELLNTDKVGDMPEVPKEEPLEKEATKFRKLKGRGEEEEDMKELAAWAN